MAGDRNGSGWSKGKILALVIPACVVVIAVAVTLFLVLGKDNSKKSPGSQPTTKTPTQDEVVQEYQKIKQEADGAVKELEDLENQQAAADAAVYEQEVEQANASIEQLAVDVEEASAAVEQASADVSSAAGSVEQTSAEYQQLLTEIESYYTYIEGFTKQAVDQINYLKSVAPTLQEIQRWQSLIPRVQQAPGARQQTQLLAQLTGRAQQAFSSLQSSGAAAPESLAGFNGSVQSLTGQLNGISEQMSKALSSGDRSSFDTLASQMSSSINQAQQQLSQSLASVFNSFSSGLASSAQKVEAAIPKR